MKNIKQKYEILKFVFVCFLCVSVIYSYMNIERLTEENKHISSKSNRLEKMINKVIDVPTEIIFCGQKISFKDEITRERLQRELINLTFYKNQLELYKRRAKYFFPTIEYYLALNGLPNDLKYLAVHEAALSAKARSSANAVGLWQFISRTARAYDLKITYYVDERRHPIKSSVAACKYLKFLHKRFKDWPLAIASYNGGETRIARSMRKQGTKSFFDLSLPEETERYFFKIVATSILLKRFEKEIEAEGREVHLEAVEVLVEKDILEIKELCDEFNLTYRTFFTFNPQFRRHVIPYGRHTLMIPRNQINLKKSKNKRTNYFVFHNPKKKSKYKKP